MNLITSTVTSLFVLAALTLGLRQAAPPGHAPGDPKHQGKADADAHASKRVGEPYAFDTCAISGEKLGSMGDPLVTVYASREVRFCCPDCSIQFEHDMAANFLTLDEKIVKDQVPLYPLKTSVVSGKDLGAKPVDFTWGNRLVRVNDDEEKAAFLKDSARHVAAIDAAIIEQQGKSYTQETCPVSGDALGGALGSPKDVVLAGRLIRLC